MSATSPKTEKQLIECIATIPAGATAAETVAYILKEFRIVKLPSLLRTAQPLPRARQKWRNRESGRLVEIVSLTSSGWYGRIAWRCIDDSRGPSSGSAMKAYWVDRFDYVGEVN